MTAALDRPGSVWGMALIAGLKVLPGDPVIGLKRLVLPVSYWRTQEFAYAGRQLRLPRGARVLDAGSPKDLAGLFAWRRGYEVVATDILPRAVELSERYARALGVTMRGPGSVVSEVQDARRLPYLDGSFDAAYAISVVEHIPDDGDSKAVAELIRVVRPGGRIVITTPFAASYRETFVERDVYERARQGQERVFYERHYDADSIRKRICEIPGARVVDFQVWGEISVRGEAILTRSPMLRALLSPLEPPLSILSLKPLPPSVGTPMAAFLTLERT